MVLTQNKLLHMEWNPTDVTVLFVYCWISTCFGSTGPSSGEFVQLFTQPLDQFLCCSVRVLCTRTEQHRYWTSECVNSCTKSPEDGPVGPKHVEIQQYTNKIVTSVGFHSICWKDARYKKLKTFTCIHVKWHLFRALCTVFYFQLLRYAAYIFLMIVTTDSRNR